MPLIQCPECQREVSDAAANCPGCGHPIQAGAMVETHTTIELTSKKYKLGKLIGGVVTVLGLAIMFSGHDFGGIMAFIGVLIYFGAGVGAWWNHE